MIDLQMATANRFQLAISLRALVVAWFRDRELKPIGVGVRCLIALALLRVPVPFQARRYRSISPLGSALMT